MIKLINNKKFVLKRDEIRDTEDNIMGCSIFISFLLASLVCFSKNILKFSDSFLSNLELLSIYTPFFLFVLGVLFYYILTRIFKKILKHTNYIQKKLDETISNEELSEIAICLYDIPLSEPLMNDLKNIKQKRDIIALLPLINEEMNDIQQKKHTEIVENFYSK